jgi:hypothetical protein
MKHSSYLVSMLTAQLRNKNSIHSDICTQNTVRRGLSERVDSCSECARTVRTHGMYVTADVVTELL